MKQTKEYWLQQKWNSLRLDPDQEFPDNWSGGSNRNFTCICDCGRRSNPIFQNVVKGQSKKCGKCSYQTKEFWLAQKWGSVRVDPEQELPDEWPTKSNNYFYLLCDCGKRIYSIFSRLANGETSSCGRCSYKSKEYWLAQKWGSLRLDPDQELPEEMGPRGDTFSYFTLCDCGRRSKVTFSNLNKENGLSSCGKCSYKSKEYWLEQKWGKLKLKPNPELPLEWGPSSKFNAIFLCDCGKETKEIPFWWVGREDRYGTVSCGCMGPGKSSNSVAVSIYNSLKKNYPDAILNDRVQLKPKELDTYIPSLNLGIEFNGLVWHSEKYGINLRDPLKDHKKYLLCQEKGIRLIQIYEDEKWELILEPYLGKTQKRIKPIYRESNFKEVSTFLSQKHYLGNSRCHGTYYLIAEFKEKIVGAWVFQDKENCIEWTRACWDHDYKTWNPHEKALQMILNLGIKKPLISFSDNRFHSGELYQKLGFQLDREVKPDYYYTDGKIRKHKFNFRVPAGVDEVAQAREKGWFRIWDSGKKKWRLEK